MRPYILFRRYINGSLKREEWLNIHFLGYLKWRLLQYLYPYKPGKRATSAPKQKVGVGVQSSKIVAQDANKPKTGFNYYYIDKWQEVRKLLTVQPMPGETELQTKVRGILTVLEIVNRNKQESKRRRKRHKNW